MPSSSGKDAPPRSASKRSGNKTHARVKSAGTVKTSKADRLRIQEFEEQQRQDEWLSRYTDLPLMAIFALLAINLVVFAFSFLPKPASSSESK